MDTFSKNIQPTNTESWRNRKSNRPTAIRVESTVTV